jgi:voltage-gated potassium channel Kch
MAGSKGAEARDPQAQIVSRAIYQTFIVAVTAIAIAIVVIYYVVPLPDTVREVLYILDSLLTPIFVYDFLAHVYYARNRLKYLGTIGWLDLIGAMPGIPALRLARIPSLLMRIRELQHATPAEARQTARQRLAESTLLAVALVVILVVTVGSILIVLIEAPAEGANIKTGSDAVWWAIVTVSTVGYGDRFPVTNEGRLIGTLMIVMGVSLFSVLTSYIATQFMARRKGTGPSETDLLRQEVVELRKTIQQLAERLPPERVG